MSFQRLVLLFVAAVVSVNALTTPHVVRHAAHHHAIAARVAAPAPADIPAIPLRKRQNSKRCKPRPDTATTTTTSVTTPTTTSTTAPQTTSTTPVAPPPVVPPPPAPPAPKPPATGNSGGTNTGNQPSFMTGTQTGQGTFYATGLGACGITNKDTDYIAAVSHLLFDNFPGYGKTNPNNNPICGRQVVATYQGKSVTVAVTDRCEGCALTDLDFSPSAFGNIADFGVGRISGMTWVWK